MTSEKEGGSQFQGLVEDLEKMMKGGADKGAGEGGDEKEEGKEKGENADGEGSQDDELLGKSFEIVLADGTRVPAHDATALLKALQDSQTAMLGDQEVLGKALALTVNLVKSVQNTVVAQDAMIKSLQAEVQRLGGQGAGRKSVLTILDRPGGSESKGGGLTPDEVLAKAEAAYKAGKITGLELTTIDVALRQRVVPDEALLAKALS